MAISRVYRLLVARVLDNWRQWQYRLSPEARVEIQAIVCERVIDASRGSKWW